MRLNVLGLLLWPLLYATLKIYNIYFCIILHLRWQAIMNYYYIIFESIFSGNRESVYFLFILGSRWNIAWINLYYTNWGPAQGQIHSQLRPNSPRFSSSKTIVFKEQYLQITSFRANGAGTLNSQLLRSISKMPSESSLLLSILPYFEKEVRPAARYHDTM